MGALSKMASPEGLFKSLQDLLATKKGKMTGALVVAAILALISMRKKKRVNQGFNIANRGKNRGKGNIDSVFVYRVFKLIKICVPNIAEPVIIDFIILNISLVLRTMLSIRISTQNGLIVKSIIQANFPLFLQRIGTLALYSLPGSFINSYLEYLNKKIALRFRENLNNYFHDEYVKDKIFYQVSTIDGRLPNPDQRLTEDINKWAHALSKFYSNVSKPLLDIFLFSKKLSEIIGWIGPLSLIGWYGLSAVVLKLISPPFGMLTAQLQRLEGEFRASHTNLSNHSEEIAFYRGDKWEHVMANNIFDKLYNHSSFVATKRLYMGVYDSMLFKYGAVLVSYAVLGIPVFGSGKDEYLKNVGEDTSSITRDYIRNSSLIISLAKAMGRILSSYKEIQQLAGYTTLVYELTEVIQDIKNNKYARIMINNEDHEHQKIVPHIPNKDDLHEIVKGKINNDDFIKFMDVPLVAPNGDELLTTPVRFMIKKGKNCLFVGPNGCGKSSLYRILAQLWPLAGGELTVPDASKIYFLPQKPYLPRGTLRDQIIYPDRESRLSDEKLREIMKVVDLNHLYLREEKNGGFNSIKPWVDVLSGGERQKISFARVFYHKPMFAVLDESSSAVSMDFEHILYKKCKEADITMFTISQRCSLYPFHDYVVKFDGMKSWSFEQIIHNEVDAQDYTQI